MFVYASLAVLSVALRVAAWVSGVCVGIERNLVGP
jgi:hypothetical protein